MKYLSVVRLVILAGVALMMLSYGSLDAIAQKRGNKGGEVRGKDRAEQVKQMNEEKEKKEKKAKKSKKGKKAKKAKKAKKGRK